MTAKQVSLPESDVATQTSRCNHNSISPGLDHVQCKNCRRCWPRWHPDYERLLNQPEQLTPEQSDCSGVTISTPEQLTPEQLTPEQSDCSGVTISTPEQLTPEQLTPEQPHWVEVYSPSNRKVYLYYRYIWMDGQKMRHRHIPGGNIKSKKAIARKTEIERAIAAGWWPTEIEELINSWRQK